MEPYPPTPEYLKQKAAALSALVSGPLASSAARLSNRSRGLPSGQDLHFYNNFPGFRSPAREIAAQSDSALRSIAAWSGKQTPALLADPDEACDWLVDRNDDLLERFGASMDEFKTLREKQEGTGGGGIGTEDPEGEFQLVQGRKKKKGGEVDYERGDGGGNAGVKMVSRDTKTTAAKSKVPFHIPTIPRPQQEFSILVNNSNQPFQHVWLEKSEDGMLFVHPLEKLSLPDFIDRTVSEGDPVKRLPLESTPFKLVVGVKELKELAAKLRDVKEFAVDLEHNQYRSFQGLTCLMQISTRTEDFVIDTLKLRVHVGPYLREVFKDPTKRKVMHGADRDILWLQRDFGIYVCNLFDTGKASRVLNMERNSLEHLLNHFCGVNANKEYQNADWRLRPLPEIMVKYAREDTHYLLHIYDLMRNRLLLESSSENDPLLEVYKLSYEVCMQLYQKELLTDTSYLHIYGLSEADLNPKQLAIVSGLCEWRDSIAREEDESTGYILPNKALLEIARHMPLSSGKLRQLVKSKHPYVERNLNSVIGIIRSSIENSSSFQSIPEQLKKGRQVPAVQSIDGGYNCEPLCVAEDLMESTIGQRGYLYCSSSSSTMQNASLVAMDDRVKSATTEVFSDQISSVGRYRHNESTLISEIGCSFKLSSTDGTFEIEKMDNGITESAGLAKRASIPLAQISKKQSSAFGALFGSSSSRRKLNPSGGASMEQDKNVSVIEQIKSTVTLPFHSFSIGESSSEPIPKAIVLHSQPEILEKCPTQPAETIKLEDVISLENESDGSQSHGESPKGDEDPKHRKWFPHLPHQEKGEGPMSDLSSNFQKCFQSINERRGSKPNQEPHREVESTLPVKPFDYAAARNNIKFGQVEEGGGAEGDDDGLGTRLRSGERRKSRANNGGDRSGGFQQPRRRQAFPVSGNRSMTYH